MSRSTTASITETDVAILSALNRYTYLTAAQASRLVYPTATEVNRYVRTRLALLTENKYLLKLGGLPVPSSGSAPQVYTLDRKGRHFLAGLGIDVPEYFRPSEEREKAENRFFIKHTLASIDVLIAADLLCGAMPEVTCPAMLTERELKRLQVHVEVTGREGSPQGSRRVAVIPDGWFQLSLPEREPFSISLELDRGTEGQKYWRRKVAALAEWADGPYQATFQADSLAIAVVAPTPERRNQLFIWTKEELTLRHREEMGALFLFTAANPVTTPPESFFFDTLWLCPTERRPVSLLVPPDEGTAASDGSSAYGPSEGVVARFP